MHTKYAISGLFWFNDDTSVDKPQVRVSENRRRKKKKKKAVIFIDNFFFSSDDKFKKFVILIADNTGGKRQIHLATLSEKMDYLK